MQSTEKELWTRWGYNQLMRGNYEMELLVDSMQGFKLVLNDTIHHRKIQLTCEDAVEAHRCTNINLRQSYLSELYQGHSKEFFEWPLFIVQNSQYDQWLYEESADISKDFQLIHYAIITSEWIIDILDMTELTVEFFEI